MRVAIVGSRDYEQVWRIYGYISGLAPETVIVSGDGRGVDRIAVAYATLFGFKTLVFPPDWTNHGKGAGFRRNQTIVDNADLVVAFWRNRSRGTADTIERARRAGVPLTIIDENGTVREG